MELILFGMIAIIVIIFALARYIRKHTKAEKIHEHFTCSAGTFSIKGYKNDFKVCKDGQYTFRIKDGQIVSVKGSTATRIKKITY